MNVTEKLNSILETKEAIKTSIKNKGIDIADTDPFASYAGKIDDILTGGADLSEYFDTTLKFDAMWVDNLKSGLYTGPREIYIDDKSLMLAIHPTDNYLIWINPSEKENYSHKWTIEPNTSMSDRYLLKNVETNKYVSSASSISNGTQVLTITSASASKFMIDELGLYYEVSSNKLRFSKHTSDPNNVAWLITNTTNPGDPPVQEVYLLDGNIYVKAEFFTPIYFKKAQDIIIPDEYTSLKSMFQRVYIAPKIIGGKNVTNLNNLYYSASVRNVDLSGIDYTLAKEMNNLCYSCTNLTDVIFDNTNPVKPSSLEYAFSGCSKLTNLNLNGWDTSELTNMARMCYNNTNLQTLDISNWDVSKVTKMDYAFNPCSKLTTLDVSKWDTSSLQTCAFLFGGCSGLTELDVSNFNTSNLTSCYEMFYNCSKLTTIDVSKWNTANLTNTSRMFMGCSQLNNLDLSNWDVSKLYTVTYMFNGCSSLTNLKFPKDFGINYGTNTAAHNVDRAIYFSGCPLSYESAMDVINNVYDIASKGCNIQDICFKASTYALLSEEDIAIATNKGWLVKSI